MSFANSWGKTLPPTYRNTQASVTNTLNECEFEEFVTTQKKLKAERQANEAEEKKMMSVPAVSFTEAEAQPTEAVAEEAYQAFVEEAEKPKSKKKKKTEEVVEETSDETPVVED